MTVRSTVPARVFAILARDAPVGVVFRRGPSKLVCTLAWDLENDTFELGQWLKGKIYPMRADLSPDGKHMIYFAMDGRRRSVVDWSWTAVSRTPWLTALHLYGWGHCWNGGGIFTSNTTYWLNSGPMGHGQKWLGDGGLSRRRAWRGAPSGFVSGMSECPLTYVPRLVRDGWRQTDDGGDRGSHRWVFERPIRPPWTLEKTFHSRARGGPRDQAYWETHRVLGPRDPVEMVGVDWADVHREGVVFAQAGVLWRQRFHEGGPADPTQLIDLNPLVFEPRVAPYEGVRT